MSRTFDIAPLRSLVTIADRGGFGRAATTLHLSQAAVSQHVRRLEATVGRPLVTRAGRGSRFTVDGEQLLGHARRVLAAHDEALRTFGVGANDTLVVGSTEHGAAQLLPRFASALGEALPHHGVQFRIDRGAALREGLAEGRVSLALLLGPTGDLRATGVGDLELTWFAARGWRLPRGPVPVVAFDAPCALRSRAIETLDGHGIASVVGAEASNLAGVHAAAAAGQGVALLATLGDIPAGLAPLEGLPQPQPLPLSIWAAADVPARVARTACDALRPLLPATSAAHATLASRLALAEGA